MQVPIISAHTVMVISTHRGEDDDDEAHPTLEGGRLGLGSLPLHLTLLVYQAPGISSPGQIGQLRLQPFKLPPYVTGSRERGSMVLWITSSSSLIHCFLILLLCLQCASAGNSVVMAMHTELQLQGANQISS